MNWLRRKWRSISFRSGLGSALVVGTITAIVLLLLTLVVFASFFFSGASLQASLMERVSDQLLLGVEPADISAEATSAELLDELGFWAILSDDEVIAHQGSYDRAVIDAPFRDTGVFLDDETTLQFRVAGTKLIDGEQWLLLENTVDDYRVVTGSTGDYIYFRFLLDGLRVLVPVLLAVMAVAGLITSWFTRRALGAVEKMRVEVEQITQESLDRRVPATGSGDRVDKLAVTMNDMLERLEASTDQQNQFLADASHELRSPVAGLVAQLDVASNYPDTVDTAVLLPKLQSETQRLQLILDDLMFLSRSEAGDTRALPAPGQISVDDVLEAELAHQQLLHPSLSISRSGSTEALVVGNERDLARAIRNLADNAARHCQTLVELGVTDTADSVTISITDDGHGIAPEDVTKIFDRFVRLDESRARDAGGSGLGLAIVTQIVGAHGGTVAVSESSSTGTTFTVELPRSG